MYERHSVVKLWIVCGPMTARGSRCPFSTSFA
jgi:hypothetical protein